jgi:2-C-methyl-D-erythritol 4-phosphate cytidylyltransferase
METKVIAIVPSAGLGIRFGTSERKHFAKVVNKPLLFYTLNSLNRIKSITEIIPVFSSGDMDRGLNLIDSWNLNKIKRVAKGGKERQDSVYNALKLIENDKDFFCDDCLVLVHDGVRPLVSEDLVERLLKEVRDADGVVPGLSMTDTIKEVDQQGNVLSTVKREEIRAIQTPQVFRFDVINQAYDSARTDGYYSTDDAALVERIGKNVKVIKGDVLNIKVTTREDMDFVETLLKKRECQV